MNFILLITTKIRDLLHIRNFNIIITIIPILTFLLLLYLYILTRYEHLISAIVFCLIPAIFAFFYVLILTPLVIFIAQKTKIMDQTTCHDLDKKPTPLLGGVSLYLSFVLVGLLYLPFTPQWKSILIASSIIFVIGTIDDIRPLSSTIRLFGQISASFIIMSSGLMVSFMPDNFWGSVASVLITLIWILGIINATNFSDGVDGLAAGIIVIAALFFFFITLHLGQYHVSLICTILIGCGMGFLVFNFKPAKIYLGDGGSTFLGFLIASIALYGEWSSRGPIIALGIPVLILGVLIFDMIYITFSRIRNGHVNNFKEWLDYTGRDHFHHRLINLGFSEKNSVIFIYIVCIVLGISALQIENARLSYPVVIQLIQSTLIFLLIIMLMLMGRKLSN